MAGKYSWYKGEPGDYVYKYGHWVMLDPYDFRYRDEVMREVGKLDGMHFHGEPDRTLADDPNYMVGYDYGQQLCGRRRFMLW